MMFMNTFHKSGRKESPPVEWLERTANCPKDPVHTTIPQVLSQCEDCIVVSQSTEELSAHDGQPPRR